MSLFIYLTIAKLSIIAQTISSTFWNEPKSERDREEKFSKKVLKYAGCDAFPTFPKVHQRNTQDRLKLQLPPAPSQLNRWFSFPDSCVRAEYGNFPINWRTIALFISLLSVFLQETKPSHFSTH